jgi:hypothetical protein
VRNALPDPPSTRTLVAEGFAPKPPTNNIGYPWVRYNTVRPEGIDSLKFGEADMTAQGAYVRTYYSETEWGTARVTHWRQHIWPEMFPKVLENGESLDNVQYGKPRMNPYTIWARTDTPQQAQRNHPGESYHPVDGKLSPGHANSRRPWWGHAVVTNRNRTIYPYHRYDTGWSLNGRTKWGDPSLISKVQRITPEGVLSMRFTFPILIPHTKKIFGIGLKSDRFGEHRVEKEFDAIWAGGLHSLSYGPVLVQNWVRPIYPSGFAATRWGNNTPMVHYPRRFSIGDYDATQYGVTWVSHRIRHVEPVGEVMTQADWESFNDRMIVRERYRPNVSGTDHLQVGQARISTVQQFIRPYMIPPPCMPCWQTGVRHG